MVEKVVLELKEGTFPLWFNESLDWTWDQDKGTKSHWATQWEMEPGFRDFQSFVGSASAPASSGRVSVHNINWHRKADIIISLALVHSDALFYCRISVHACADLHVQDLMKLLFLYWSWAADLCFGWTSKLSPEDNNCSSNKGLCLVCVHVFKGHFTELTLCYM